MERHHILHTADNNTFCWQTSRLMQIAWSLAYMQVMHEHENTEWVVQSKAGKYNLHTRG